MIRALFITVFVLLELNLCFSSFSIPIKDLQTASEIYLRLKNVLGHWHNFPSNPAIDDFNGARHTAMIQLQKYLGQVGTSSNEITRLMGKPTKILDKPDLALEHEFHRIEDGFVYPNDGKIWIYEWRNMHDFVYFVLSGENQVVRSGWFNAFELD